HFCQTMYCYRQVFAAARRKRYEGLKFEKTHKQAGKQQHLKKETGRGKTRLLTNEHHYNCTSLVYASDFNFATDWRKVALLPPNALRIRRSSGSSTSDRPSKMSSSQASVESGIVCFRSRRSNTRRMFCTRWARDLGS